MTLLAPGFLLAAVAAALAVTALHFIVAREPRALALPTARFIPETPTHALVRSRRFSDPWLLVVRVMTLLAIGAALARPVRTPRRERVARVIMADVSSAPLRAAEVRDSVRALYRPGDAIVAFDSMTHRIGSPDSLSLTPIGGAGSITAALVAAHAAASGIREGADSIEMVIVSPFTTRETDRATPRVRALWPGRVRTVVVAPDTTAAAAPRIEWHAATRPTLAVPRSPADTIGAVAAGTDVVVAPFVRRWRYAPDSLRGATVVARWSDGEPAAVERPATDAGACERSIAIPVDSTSDLTLRPPFVRLAARLAGPCASAGGAESTQARAAIAHLVAGSGALARAAGFPPGPAAHSSIAPWLLALAGLLALVELFLRRRRNAETAP